MELELWIYESEICIQLTLMYQIVSKFSSKIRGKAIDFWRKFKIF